MKDLKPCPFCGGEPYISQNCYGEVYVRCPYCGAIVLGNDKSDIRSKKEAIKLWNRRTENA